MRIIKHGKYYNQTHTFKCSCECEFEVEFSDYKDNKIYSSTLNRIIHRVQCPECGHIFTIEKETKYE